MAVRLSTACKNAFLDRVCNGGTVTAAFDSGVLEIRSGSQPASADTAPTGTVLATINVPADAFAAASAGSIAKAGTWQDASADNTGTAGWFRLKTSGDAGTTNTTDIRIDGAITATGGGGDMTLDNTSIASAQSVTITTFSISI